MNRFPKNQGLYDRSNEHDNCGIGLVADIKGRKSYDIIRRGLQVLERMEHRGAESADNKTGDGAGILMQIPHDFYCQEVKDLPEAGLYGTGLVFLPKNSDDLKKAVEELEKIINGENQQVIAWRDVPVDSSHLGEIALKAEPDIKQVFIAGKNKQDQAALERKLYIIRKLAENKLTDLKDGDFYMPSLSSKTIVYKGMLMPDQVYEYFLDLQNEAVTTAIAIVHSRFSTNTFPAWDLAQPFRIVAHNGEINTIKGNRFWMAARESGFASEAYGDDIKKIFPVIEPDKSDSASFDNGLEMLVATGRSLPHALMMMIPESWNDKNPIPQDLKYFYEYHSTFMEPWDGPASMVFTDGRYVGGTLDRNGLRPSRYVVTNNDLIVMGSEVGVQEFPAEEVKYKGRLMPGKLLFVDTVEGRIIPDKEIKHQIANQKPYGDWVQQNRVNLADIPVVNSNVKIDKARLKELQLMFGYNREDIETIITPMVQNSMEPTGSMGSDTPLAAFSDQPQRMFSYFKQIFAQVTNPAIDPIREELVMTLTSYIGKQKNLLDESPEHCKMVKFKNPVMTNQDVNKIRQWENADFTTVTLDMTFKANQGKEGLTSAIDKLCKDAEAKIDSGNSFIVLSDRKVDKDNAPIPSLIACGALHHYLIRKKKRTLTGIIVETAEAREVHHFAVLFGYGADAINPYGAFATIYDLYRKGLFDSKMDYPKAEISYIKAVSKGLLKIFSKMGVSTLRSYRGAQVYEALGVGEELIDKCFVGTTSRIKGIGFAEVAEEVLRQHKKAYSGNDAMLESAGIYRFRKNGEKHAWNPETIHLLQWATSKGDYDKYKEFSRLVTQQNRKPHFIRGFFDFNKVNQPISIDEVEPIEDIMKRLTTGAMSFGSLSKEVHETIAIALNEIGGRSNSGEGGENPVRFKPYPDGTLARSAIKQVASGRFGVSSHYLANADEIQIKVAQGAKPGEGGQLPGHKVDEIIAKTRNSTPGVTLISPPPHHDIYSIEDLAQLIFDLKNANPKARISVKLVSEAGVGTVAAGVAKAHADNILISGYDGGTGASPVTSIKHAGLPFELGISETHQTLVLNNLRGRVRLQTDGQLKNGTDVVMAAMLGAEEFGFGTSVLIVLGCVMMRKCHLNTCPVGVATQHPELRKRFKGKAKYLVNYFKFMAQEVREILAELGFKKLDDIVGRTDLLKTIKADHWKAKTIDPAGILFRSEDADKRDNHCVQDQIHKIDDILDRELIEKSKPALEKEKAVNIETKIKNTDRAVGAMLSYNVSLKYEQKGLPGDLINVTFKGSAGQSFGAFLAKGISFRLEGDANDYLGKGLSGGKIVVVPPQGSSFKAEENIIVGNTLLYGATAGEVYIRGIAGERFCVRNSGAEAVVEGTGDHCAEYMTGGKVIVLGNVGRNFGAGMSGGIAYVLNQNGKFNYFCNMGMIELSWVEDTEEQEYIKQKLIKHIEYTDSEVAKRILDNWNEYLPKFIKVMPLEYKRALKEMELKKLEERLKKVREEEQLGEASDG